MNLSLWKKRPTSGSLMNGNGEFARLQNEINRTFERFLSEPFEAFDSIEPKWSRGATWLPPLDISETDAGVTIRAEIPGVAGKDLDISISGTTLSISGKKEEVTEKKDENYCQCERRFGSFRRVVELPETIDAEKISAESDNGVVTIHIAKKPGAKPKQIEVKTSAKKVPVTA